MKITLRAQIEEVRYELRMRESVYPRLVRRGGLRAGEAELHMRRMRAALRTLEWLDALVKREGGMINRILPKTHELPALVWAWPACIPPADHIRYAAQYALWLHDPDEDGKKLRVAVSCMVAPRLLLPMLTKVERAEWIRLMGLGATYDSQDWGSAFQTLIASGQLQEGAAGEWMRGPYFSPDGLRRSSHHAQRALFVIEAIRRSGLREREAAA